MRHFSGYLFVCIMLVKAADAAYLPVVDVSNGTVSARAAFGEEITTESAVTVEPVVKKSERKIVSRTAKTTKTSKPVAKTVAVADVLKPQKPSSDLWARTSDAPLRMPRMDEIAVVRSEALLPEESLDAKPLFVASEKTMTPRSESAFVEKDEAMAELKQLREEVNRLSRLQQEQEKIAIARPMPVRTPIAADTNVKPVTSGDVKVRREVVPMETQRDVIMRSTAKNTAEPTFASVNDMTKMTPGELKKAFKKTYLSENKHLSTYQVDNRYDEASDMSVSVEGFTSERDLSEIDSGIRPLEIKISFLNGDSGLSRENYNLLSETAAIVVNNPKRAIQIAIPESATRAKDSRKLASRRLAIVEQVLRDTGVSEQRIIPVLSQRDDDVFVLRIISGDAFESLTQQKRNMFGDSVSKKTYKSMSW